MNARITVAALAIASLSVGYAVGRSQWVGHAMAQAGGGRASSAARSLPADDEGSKERLNKSPRHGEWAKVTVNDAPVNTWVVYPERRDKAPVVVVIHEIFGLSDWIRAVADQLAAEGFIAVAPDLLSGHGPNGGGTEAYASRDDVTKAVPALPRNEVLARLNGVRDYGLKLPAANGKSAVVGFCFGGSQSFAFALAQPGLSAAVVYYGTAPAESGAAPGSFTPAASLANIKPPVLGLYGSDDARVDATVPATEAKMKELGKTYEPHMFEGAGHGFLRAQTDQNGANMKAAQQAWSMTIAWLKKYTS